MKRLVNLIKRRIRNKSEEPAKFVLPKCGDIVGLAEKEIEWLVQHTSQASEAHFRKMALKVISACGDESENIIYLHNASVMYAGEWRLLPENTPLHS